MGFVFLITVYIVIKIMCFVDPIEVAKSLSHKKIANIYQAFIVIILAEYFLFLRIKENFVELFFKKDE